jgi:hypothetical protein
MICRVLVWCAHPPGRETLATPVNISFPSTSTATTTGVLPPPGACGSTVHPPTSSDPSRDSTIRSRLPRSESRQTSRHAHSRWVCGSTQLVLHKNDTSVVGGKCGAAPGEQALQCSSTAMHATRALISTSETTPARACATNSCVHCTEHARAVLVGLALAQDGICRPACCACKCTFIVTILWVISHGHAVINRRRRSGSKCNAACCDHRAPSAGHRCPFDCVLKLANFLKMGGLRTEHCAMFTGLWVLVRCTPASGAGRAQGHKSRDIAKGTRSSP